MSGDVLDFTNLKISWHHWLTPVILATQEAEIRRITVQSQPRANSSQDPISKNPSQIGLVEWLKVKGLSSIPSTPHTQKKNISLKTNLFFFCFNRLSYIGISYSSRYHENAFLSCTDNCGI
jgi:hypothetical protein